MRKLLLPIGLGVLILAAGAGGWYWWTHGRFVETTDNAYVESDISSISPKVAGYIHRLNVVDNQQVRAGDVLAVIDDRDFAARVGQARAAVTGAQAAVVSIDRKIDLQAALIDQAAAAVESAEAERARAQPEYERYKKMVATNIVGKSDYDRTAADLRKAEAELVRAKAELTAARGQLVVLQAEREEALARLEQGKAALAVAEIDLDNTILRAPVDGVVGNKAVEVGQYVRAGAQLMAVVPLPEVHVVANFKETQLERMRPGQRVEISVDAYPGVTLEGSVESFAPASGAVFSLLPPENATGNFTKIVQRVPVRIAVPEDNPLAGLLRPGLSVEVRIDTRAAEDAPTLAGGVFGVAQAAQ
ncbi:MAG: HlyD family secretion protein [Dongiaceae bacterium]